MNNNILNKLDPELQSKYEAEVKQFLENLGQDNNVSEEINEAINKEIDEIFNSTDNAEEIEAKVKLVIIAHLKSKNKDIDRVKSDNKKIAKDIDEFCAKINKDDLDQENYVTSEKKDKDRLLTKEAKKNLKKILQSFIVYEIYKVMNPRRIAGETHKDNYFNNLIRGGVKLASKHTGGKEADLKKYGSAEVERMQKQAAKFRSKGHSIERER
jgi:Glu-tRNA(Gln) amidotransferase subunit E-like FAD-binding protein